MMMYRNDTHTQYLINFYDDVIQKSISDIKFHQNHDKLSFSMVFIGFYPPLIEIPFKNGSKQSKMIQNDVQTYQITIVCDNVVQKMNF